MDLPVIFSVIIACFSFIVVLLLGWNIYSMWDLVRARKALEAAKETVIRSSQMQNTLTMMAISDFYYYQMMDSDPLGVEFKYTYYRVSSMLSASKIKDIDTCNVIVKVILETLTHPENIKLTKSSKDNLLTLYLAVEHKEQIVGYNEMLALLNRLGVSK